MPCLIDLTFESLSHLPFKFEILQSQLLECQDYRGLTLCSARIFFHLFVCETVTGKEATVSKKDEELTRQCLGCEYLQWCSVLVTHSSTIICSAVSPTWGLRLHLLNSITWHLSDAYKWVMKEWSSKANSHGKHTFVLWCDFSSIP